MRTPQLMMCLAALLLVVPAYAQDANGDGVDDVLETNLVPDGDMETETPWARYGTVCAKTADAALQGAQGLRCGPGGAGARVEQVPVMADTLYRVRWRHRLNAGALYVFVGTTTDGAFTGLAGSTVTITTADDVSGWGERMVRTPADVGDGLSVVFLATGQADVDAVSVVAAAADASVLAGGDFERVGEPGWQPYGKTRCTRADDAGNGVLRCGGSGTLEQTGMPVAGEQIYTLRYRVRVNSSVVQTYLGSGGNFTLLPGGFARHSADGAWQVYEQRFGFNTVPTKPLRLIIYTLGEADFDDVTLVPAAPLADLAIDGGFEGSSTLAWTTPRLVSACMPSAEAALEGGLGLRCGQGAQSRQTVGVVGGEAYLVSVGYRSDTEAPTTPLGLLPAAPDWVTWSGVVDVDGDQTSLDLAFEGQPALDVDAVQVVRLPDALQSGEFRSVDGWRRYSQIACTLDAGGFGSDESLRCAPGGMTQRGFALTPGQNYRLRFAWRNGANSYLWAFVGVRTAGVFAGIPGMTMRFHDDTAGVWQVHEVVFTAPDPGAGVFDLTFYADGDASLDAVSITPTL